MRVVAIANQKGGVGKTTTIINLAAGLAELGQRILVVDMDPQSNATSGLGLPQQHGTSLYQALLGRDSIVNLVQQTETPGIDIVPSELDLTGAEIDIARVEDYLHCFEKSLQALGDSEHDFILVDCPPSLGILTMNALTAAHSILIPMQCEYYALEGLSVILSLVNRLRNDQVNEFLEIEGILMTMYDRRTNLSSEVVEEVRKHFDADVYNTVIPRNIRLSEAPSYGEPVLQYDKHSTGANAYRQFAREFLERANQSADIPSETPASVENQTVEAQQLLENESIPVNTHTDDRSLDQVT